MPSTRPVTRTGIPIYGDSVLDDIQKHVQEQNKYFSQFLLTRDEVLEYEKKCQEERKQQEIAQKRIDIHLRELEEAIETQNTPLSPTQGDYYPSTGTVNYTQNLTPNQFFDYYIPNDFTLQHNTTVTQREIQTPNTIIHEISTVNTFQPYFPQNKRTKITNSNLLQKVLQNNIKSTIPKPPRQQKPKNTVKPFEKTSEEPIRVQDLEEEFLRNIETIPDQIFSVEPYLLPTLPISPPPTYETEFTPQANPELSRIILPENTDIQTPTAIANEIEIPEKYLKIIKEQALEQFPTSEYRRYQKNDIEDEIPNTPKTRRIGLKVTTPQIAQKVEEILSNEDLKTYGCTIRIIPVRQPSEENIKIISNILNTLEKKKSQSRATQKYPLEVKIDGIDIRELQEN